MLRCQSKLGVTLKKWASGLGVTMVDKASQFKDFRTILQTLPPQFVVNWKTWLHLGSLSISQLMLWTVGLCLIENLIGMERDQRTGNGLKWRPHSGGREATSQKPQDRWGKALSHL